MINEYLAFTESLEFFTFRAPMLLINSADRVAAAFISNAQECLQSAHIYAMDSARIFNTNENLNWSTGYGPHFLLRTIAFSTAVSWYSNCYDHILQIVYWAYNLYTAVVDRAGNAYDDEISTLYETHCSLFHCLTEIVKSINLESRALQFPKQVNPQLL